MTTARAIFKAIRSSEKPTIMVSFLYGILDPGPFYHLAGRRLHPLV